MPPQREDSFDSGRWREVAVQCTEWIVEEKREEEKKGVSKGELKVETESRVLERNGMREQGLEPRR